MSGAVQLRLENFEPVRLCGMLTQLANFDRRQVGNHWGATKSSRNSRAFGGRYGVWQRTFSTPVCGRAISKHLRDQPVGNANLATAPGGNGVVVRGNQVARPFSLAYLGD